MAQSPSDALRAKAKKLEMLASLLEDDEMVSAIKEILVEAPEAPKARTIPDKPKKTPSRKSTRGGLEDAVMEFAQAAPQGSAFGARDVTDVLESMHYPFGAKDHAIAVAKVLRRLHEKGLLDMHKDDKGGVTYWKRQTPKLPLREIA